MLEVFGTLVLLLAPIEKLAAYTFYFSCTECGFVLSADRFCDTSSIMPQKRNPFLIYNVASKVHGVYSAFFEDILEETALVCWPRGSMIKRAFADTKDALDCARLNIGTMKVNKEKVLYNLSYNWCCATDLAGALVREHGLSWRSAYMIVAIITRWAEEKDIPSRDLNNKMIEDASMEHLGKKLRLKESTIKEVLDPMVSIRTRTLTGGPAPENSRKSIAEMKMGVEIDKEFIKTARERLASADAKLDSAVDKILSDKS
jgi:argininosuccinate lyase